MEIESSIWMYRFLWNCRNSSRLQMNEWNILILVLHNGELTRSLAKGLTSVTYNTAAFYLARESYIFSQMPLQTGFDAPCFFYQINIAYLWICLRWRYFRQLDACLKFN